MSKQERILGSARLSHGSDTSSSIVTQRADIASVATYRNATIVHVTEDTDVSGGLSPFERPGLGPWLTDPALIASWDTLVVAKLDRLSRSIFDFAELVKWCEKNGKNLISKAEEINLTNAAGRLMVKIIVLFAEFERERIAERHQQGNATRRAAGAWTSGTVPFGMVAIRKGAYRYLAPGPDAPVYRDVVAEILRGESANEVARGLTLWGKWSRAGHGTWDASHVIDMLRSPIYTGQLVTREVTGTDTSGKRTHAKRSWIAVKDASGERVRHDAALINQADWDLLQERLDGARVRRAAPGRITRLLTSVAECSSCGATLTYHHVEGRKARLRHAKGAQCPEGGLAGYGALDTEVAFELAFLASQGGRKLTEVIVLGEDLSGMITALETRLSDVEAEVIAGTMPAGPGARIMAAIEADLTSARGRHSAGTVVKELEKTLADAWRAAGTQEKNRFLCGRGVRVIASADGISTNDFGSLPTLAKFWAQPVELDEAA